MKIHKYADILLEYFYLDSNNRVRYKIDSYKGLHKAGELVQVHLNQQGYNVITIPTRKTTINFSHLVLLLYYGNLPSKFEADHIDGNRSNDNICNLRIVDDVLNSKNRKKRIDNSTGITGVCYKPERSESKPYHVRKTVRGVRISTYCATLEEAQKIIDELQSLDGNYTDRHGK